MKTLQVLSIRKNTDPHVAALEAEYMKRLRPLCMVEAIDIRVTYAEGASVPEILAKDAALMRKKIPARATVVALHETGKTHSSREFSEWTGRTLQAARGPVVFLIGGPYGLDAELVRETREVISLSRMTFTHELVRLLLFEQLYRAFQITRGTDYHK